MVAACGKLRNLIFLIAVSFLFLQTNYAAMAETIKKPRVSIDYFYVNACGSCDEEGKFRLRFDNIIGKLDDNADVDLKMHNTFHGDEAKLMKEYFDDYKVPEEKRLVPVLFLNGIYLSGEKEIESRLKAEFTKALQSDGRTGGRIVANRKEDEAEGGNGKFDIVKNKSDDSILLYFYVSSCDDCNKVSKEIGKLKSSYSFLTDGREIVSSIVLKKYNVGDDSNMYLLKRYFDYYRVPEKDRKVPIIFMGDEWFSGADSIQSSLKDAVSSGKGVGTVELACENSRPDDHATSLAGYDIPGVVAAGLVNGFNPCSISIVLFFFSLLVVKKVNLFKAGISFISGKFITFFLLGTLLYQLFLKADIHWFQTAAKTVFLILATVFVVLNLRDMRNAKRENYDKILLQLPENLRRINHRLVKVIVGMDCEKTFLPLSFLLGMVIAAGEFLCTGQIYLATIILVLQNNTVFGTRAMIYFALYGLAFIFPLLILTLLIYKGKEVFDVSESFRSKLPVIKMINAFVFFVFALLAVILF